MATANDREPEADRKKRQHRSPAYPSMTLEAALKHAATIYKHEKRSAAPVAVVAEHCGTDIKSSKGLRLIAALKQFGLVKEEGSGDDRQVRLSERALDYLLADNDDGIRAALQAAALAPPIHKKIWETYPNGLPSDATLKSYLIRTLDFNDAYVDGFIKKLRATLAFAELVKSDKIDQGEDEGEDDEGAHAMDTVVDRGNSRTGGPTGASGTGGFSPPKPPAGTRDFPLYTSGTRGALYVPERMSKKDFDLLKRQIENSLLVIEATAVADEQESQ